MPKSKETVVGWWFSYLLLASILVRHLTRSENVSDGNDLEDTDDVARRGAIKDLCQNTPGCTCDGRNEQVNCTCAMKNHNFYELNLGNVNIPVSVTVLKIANCSSVVINPIQSPNSSMKLLHIASVNKLSIGANILRKVNETLLENIARLEGVDAFDQLEGDKLTFTNVSFPVGNKELKPYALHALKIERCNLTDTSIILDVHPYLGKIIIVNSRLDRVKLKINAPDLILNGNVFVNLPSDSSGLVDIQYSYSLKMEGNTFRKELMPSINSNHSPSLVFGNLVNRKLSDDSRRWLNHFKFIFSGPTHKMKPLEKTCTEEVNSTDNQILYACPSVQMLEKHLNSNSVPGDSQGRTHRQEKQVQGDVNSSVSVKQSFYLPVSIVGAMFLHSIKSFYCC